MIRIVTDSAADLTARDLEIPGVTVVPLGITFADGTAALDDGSMTKDEFFTRLAEDSKLPRTSQPSPASFIELFEEAADAGDEVIVITIAQKLSGTYQCANLAAAEAEALTWPGVYYVRTWLNEGRCSVGDSLMYVLIGADIRPNCIDALQKLVGHIKNELVVEKEIFE